MAAAFTGLEKLVNAVYQATGKTVGTGASGGLARIFRHLIDATAI